MCLPALAAVAAGASGAAGAVGGAANALTIGGTLLGAGASVYSGIAAKRAADYEAAVAKMNGELSAQRAADAMERGADEEQKQRMKTAQLIGQQQAAMAANGVDLGFGSPLDTMVDAATLGELDALTIRRNTARENFDERVQGANFRASASMSRMTGRNALIGGVLEGAGTLLSGGAKAFGAYRAANPVPRVSSAGRRAAMAGGGLF